jgi:aminopeptidase N
MKQSISKQHMFHGSLCGAILMILAGMFSAAHAATRGEAAGKVDTAHFYTKHSYDILKYSLDLDLYNCFRPTQVKTFDATEVVTFRVDSTLRSINLDAVNSSVTVRSVGKPASSFLQDSDLLKIRLNRTYHPGEIVTLKITYSHKDISDDAFFSSGGLVFTDSPPEGARKWFPCWDRPSDKALVDLRAKVPSKVRVASVGKLAGTTRSGDTAWYQWTSKDPVSTYLIAFTAGENYHLDTKYWRKPGSKVDSIPAMFFYLPKENPAPVMDLIDPMTDFLSRMFGAYPFEKIGFATLNDAFRWGGMENQTLVFLRHDGWQEGLAIHEFSHQWFGDLITCATWADVWLNESFATYCESLWYEHTRGEAAYRNRLKEQAAIYLANDPGLPIYDPAYAIKTPDPERLYNMSLVYYKGACVLHQLRYILGDDLFLHALHDYATDSSLVYKNAATGDFIKHMNLASGTDLRWFFREWLDRPGYPEYANAYDFVGAVDGSWDVKFYTAQVQATGGFFKMPLQLKIGFNDGTDTVIRVLNERNHELFEFTFDKEPIGLSFDPFDNILLKKAVTTRRIPKESEAEGFALRQSIPNPCKHFAKIEYMIPAAENVKISIYDEVGNLVETPVNDKLEAGSYYFIFDGREIPAGIYYYRMEAGKFNDTRQMYLTK